MAATTVATHPYLAPEILGFVPQLLLDDIINIVNTAVNDAVDGMEEYLETWVNKHTAREGEDWDGKQEVEQGLISFQTLLEHHTDLAFDFFEAWSLRNVFAIPPDLPIVVPHQQNLDLTVTPAREKELVEELESLRAKLDNQRRLRRTYKRALLASAKQRKRAEQRLERLSFLASPSLDTMAAIPERANALVKTLVAVPTLDPTSTNQVPLPDPSKRQWETGKIGYFNWAVGELLQRGTSRASGSSSTAVDALAAVAENVGQMDVLKAAVEAVHADLESLDSAVG